MTPGSPGRSGAVRRYLFPGVLAFGVWWFADRSVIPLAKWLTYPIFGLAAGTHLAEASS